MSVLLNPDCMNSAHKACSGDGWCEATDQLAPCPCDCHQPQEHYEGCPCGACQGVRAAQPVATAMEARHLSGASIGKLVEYSTSRSLTTNEHLWSPGATLAHLTHGADRTELHIRWDQNNTDLIDLRPDDWVRVTKQPAGATT